MITIIWCRISNWEKIEKEQTFRLWDSRVILFRTTVSINRIHLIKTFLQKAEILYSVAYSISSLFMDSEYVDSSETVLRQTKYQLFTTNRRGLAILKAEHSFNISKDSIGVLELQVK